MLALSCSPAAPARRGADLFAEATLVLDFTRRMARLNGARLPLEAVLSCQRASPGKALSAGGTLHDFAPNTLRCTSRGLLVEEPRTNYFPNSFAPATTGVNLPAGTFTLSLRGTGSAGASGAATGVATALAPLTFTLAAPGTVTVTPAGGPTCVQLENGSFATSPIATNAGPATRQLDGVSLLDTSWFNPQNCTIMVEWEQVAPGQGVQTLLRWQNASFSRLRSGNFATVQVNDAGANLILNASAPTAPPPLGIHRLAAALAPNNMTVAWSASLGGGTAGSVQDTTGTPAPSVSGITLGSNMFGEVLNGWIQRLAVWTYGTGAINELV